MSAAKSVPAKQIPTLDVLGAVQVHQTVCPKPKTSSPGSEVAFTSDPQTVAGNPSMLKRFEKQSFEVSRARKNCMGSPTVFDTATSNAELVTKTRLPEVH